MLGDWHKHIELTGDFYFSVQSKEQDILNFLTPFDLDDLSRSVPVFIATSQEESHWPAGTANTKNRIIDYLGQKESE